MSQRPPQPARDVKVQRRPERRLERLLKPPATCGTRQLSSQSLSSVLHLSTCSARLQTVRNVKACVQPPCQFEHCSMSWRAHACRTCTYWPAFIHCRTHPLHCEAQRRPTQFLVRYLCRKLVQAHSPRPGGHTGAGHVHTQAALRRMLLKGLQAAIRGCGKAGSRRHCSNAIATRQSSSFFNLFCISCAPVVPPRWAAMFIDMLRRTCLVLRLSGLKTVGVPLGVLLKRPTCGSGTA
jgi:hypothetical protein